MCGPCHAKIVDARVSKVVVECSNARLPGCHRHPGGVDDPPLVGSHPDSDFQPRNRHECPRCQLTAPGLRTGRSRDDRRHRRNHDFRAVERQHGRPQRAAANHAPLSDHHDDHLGTIALAGVFPAPRTVCHRRPVELPDFHYPTPGLDGRRAHVPTPCRAVTGLGDRGDLLHDRPDGRHHCSDDHRNPDHHHGVWLHRCHRRCRAHDPQPGDHGAVRGRPGTARRTDPSVSGTGRSSPSQSKNGMVVPPVGIHPLGRHCDRILPGRY